MSPYKKSNFYAKTLTLFKLFVEMTRLEVEESFVGFSLGLQAIFIAFKDLSRELRSQ